MNTGEIIQMMAILADGIKEKQTIDFLTNQLIAKVNSEGLKSKEETVRVMILADSFKFQAKKKSSIIKSITKHMTEFDRKEKDLAISVLEDVEDTNDLKFALLK